MKKENQKIGFQSEINPKIAELSPIVAGARKIAPMVSVIDS